jgi:hypothetical protein
MRNSPSCTCPHAIRDAGFVPFRSS